MDKISVIIPCYNAELYLNACLNSILEQTHKNIEIICVDDGSSDKTIDILNEYQHQYPLIIKVISIDNGGASAARNKGFQMSQGNYIQFLDADDILAPLKFEKQLEGFEQGNTDVVVSDRIRKNHELTADIQTYYFDEIENNPLETAITKIIITGNPIYKRKVVGHLGGYDETLTSAQDWDFHIRMVLAGFRIKYVPGIHFISRDVSNSISSNWIKVSIQAAEVILKLKEKLLASQLLNLSTRQYLARIYMDSALFSYSVNRSQKYIRELLFWSDGTYSFVNGGMKRLMIGVIGIKNTISIQRMFYKNKLIK